MMPKPGSDAEVVWGGFAFILLAFIIYIVFFAGETRSSIGVDAVGAVKARLRDPGSATFDHLRKGKSDSYCGLVNGTNGVGGMSGQQAFVFTEGRAVLTEDGIGAALLINRLCSRS